jgi:flagellar biosynthesis protein FliQ
MSFYDDDKPLTFKEKIILVTLVVVLSFPWFASIIWEIIFTIKHL